MLGAMTDHHLAQLNIARMRAPLDDPLMADFVALLDPVNALAEASPGFVWRLVGEGESDATSLRPFGPDWIVNLTVWADVEALWNFSYRTDHLDLVRRRRSWFHLPKEAHMVLWWLPAGHLPSVEEAAERLARLREHGPTPEAFTFGTRFPAPEAAPAAPAAPSPAPGP